MAGAELNEKSEQSGVLVAMLMAKGSIGMVL